MARILSQFTIVPNGSGDYTLTMEDEDGESVEFVASYEQLDLVAEALQEQLDSDEEDVLGVDDEAEVLDDE
jgi:hypothetical protein